MFLRPKRAKLSLDMAPLIDVVFQLLVFFMLSSTFVNPALSLELPRASSNAQPQQQPLVVSVDDGGAIFINQQEVAEEDFHKRLAALLADQNEKTVNFRGDRAMRYETFVRLMDLARKAGAQKFNIVHLPQD
jgi:biopolymer transport protein ExbD